MDTDIRDIDGLTPADLAEECKHTDCADFLKSPLQVNTCFNISYRYIPVFCRHGRYKSGNVKLLFTDKKCADEYQGLFDDKYCKVSDV